MGLKKIWNKTIFPEMIKNYKEEKNIKREIQAESRKEALQELKPHLKNVYKQEILDKMSGKKKTDWMGKLAKNLGGVETSDKKTAKNKAGIFDKDPVTLMGLGDSSAGGDIIGKMGMGSIKEKDPVGLMTGKKSSKDKKKKGVTEDAADKVKRMLG